MVSLLRACQLSSLLSWLRWLLLLELFAVPLAVDPNQAMGRKLWHLAMLQVLLWSARQPPHWVLPGLEFQVVAAVAVVAVAAAPAVAVASALAVAAAAYQTGPVRTDLPSSY